MGFVRFASMCTFITSTFYIFLLIRNTKYCRSKLRLENCVKKRKLYFETERGVEIAKFISDPDFPLPNPKLQIRKAYLGWSLNQPTRATSRPKSIQEKR